MNKRCVYFDVLKVVAIIAVIINHSYWYLASNDIISFSIKSFILILVKFAVPVFVMVSGALLLQKEHSYKEIFSKRIFRVVVPLVVISFLWAIYRHFNLSEVVVYIIRGNLDNYSPYWAWYIYVIIALYMVLPFIKKMINNFSDKDFKIFILMFLLTPSFISFGTIILEAFFHKSLYLSGYITGIWFSQYIGLFVAGYYLANKEVNAKEKNIATISLVVTVLIATIIEILNHTINGTSFLLDNCLLITTIIPALALFIISKYYLSNGFRKEKTNKLFANLSNCVFGIYLFHVFVISLLVAMPIFTDLLSWNSYLGVIVIDVITLIVLTIGVHFAKKIPIVKKFL